MNKLKSQFRRASVIIPTCNRPEDLELCLDRMLRQETDLPLEIIVTDNAPSSNTAERVVKRFPGVRLVKESRKGVSFARNTGILASRGDVLLFVDDDVLVEPGWAQAMLDAFTRPDIMAVTGRVRPYSQVAEAERLFEELISFDRGDKALEFDLDWYFSYRHRSAPVHSVGGSGNCAIRAEVFANRRIGLWNEAIGPGTPLGSSEDQFMFHRILRYGYTIVYEPKALALHKHRVTEADFYKQMYEYAKSGVGYELEIFMHDGDWRGLLQVGIVLPVWRMREAFQLLVHWLKHSKLPKNARLVATGIRGNLAGVPAWWRAQRVIRQTERSPLYRGPQPTAPLEVERDDLPTETARAGSAPLVSASAQPEPLESAAIDETQTAKPVRLDDDAPTVASVR